MSKHFLEPDLQESCEHFPAVKKQLLKPQHKKCILRVGTTNQ